MNTELLGWTMLHFLWLGTALLVVAAVVRLALRRAGANVRYTHSLATLLALAMLPIGIAVYLSGSPPLGGEGLGEGGEVDWGTEVRAGSRPGATGSASALPRPATDTGIASGTQIIELNPDYNPSLAAEPLSSPPPGGEGLGEGEALWPASGATGSASALQTPTTNTGTASGTLGQTLAYLQFAVPYLPYLWLLGTPITFALLATGLIGAERMRRHGTLITDGPVHDACERLRRSLRITRRVTLALCDRVAQPVLVGIVRPLILLPPAALAGWSPAELEMVLLHELAHVRRWDNLVNLAQRVIESLLFFHPAVWIASTWVRRDREDCCDMVVVTRTEQPKQYAELLVALASPQPLAGPSLVHTALARHPLAGRLRRILKLEDEPMLVSRNTIGLLTLAVVAIALVVVSGPLRVQGEDQPAEEAAASDPPARRHDRYVADQPAEETAATDPAPPSVEKYIEPAGSRYEPPSWSPFPLALPSAKETKTSEKTTKVYTIPPDLSHLRVFFGDLDNRKEFGIVDVQGNKLTVTASPEQFARLTEMLPGLMEDREPIREQNVTDDLKASNAETSPPAPIQLDFQWPGEEATNPLAGIAYPSPREGEIAQRAINALRLALAPATPLEREVAARHGKPSEIKIVTLSKKPHGTTLLTKIESVEIKNFDDVERALNKFQLPANGSPNVRWEAMSENNGEYLGLTSDKGISIGGKYFDPAPTPQPIPPGTVPGAIPVLSRVDTPNGPMFQLNPLANIAYPSPREGEIAKRAWKELGIKVAPAADEELDPTLASDKELQAGRGYSHRGGLKLIDFNKNFPQLQGTPILKELQSSVISTHISSFDDLDKALDAIATTKKPDVIFLNGVIGGTPFSHSLKYPVNQRKTVTRTYDVPRDTSTAVAIQDLEDWIVAQNIQTNPVGADGDGVIITATEAQHERIAKVLTNVSPKLPFLSLEDQKIADRAYKLLGVELEPLTKEELERVNKLGFAGGLRVSQSSNGGMEVGGLLVGLHVWPTKDLRALNEVLMRDDLAGLSPLKFYVVRQKMVGVPIEGRERLFRNTLSGEIVTGRVVVDVEELRAMQQAAQFSQGSNSTAGVPGRMVYESTADGTMVGRMVYPQPAPAIGAPQVPLPPTAIGPPATYAPGIPVTPPAATYAPTDPYSTPSPTFSPAPATAPPTRNTTPPPARTLEPIPNLQPTEQPAPANLPQWPTPSESNVYAQPTPPILSAEGNPPRPAPTGTSMVGPPIAVFAPQPTYVSPTPVPLTQSSAVPATTYPTAPAKPVYRYDGKTFQTWRDTWKHELSTEKRIEAVKALAAFGRAGYAKEAAETILDVAGEADGQLQTEIVNVLRMGKVPSTVWWPMLMERFKDAPEKWQGFLISVLYGLRDIDRSFVEQIDGFTQHKEPQLRSAALEALRNMDPKKFVTRVGTALQDPDSQVAIRASSLLHSQIGLYQSHPEQLPGVYASAKDLLPPEFFAVLFSSNEVLQKNGRQTLKELPADAAPKIVEQLLAVLDDESRQEDRILAIRALSTLRTNAQPAIPRLESIVKESKVQPLRIAAVVALERIASPRGRRGSGSIGTNYLYSELRDDQEQLDELMEQINEEQKQNQ